MYNPNFEFELNGLKLNDNETINNIIMKFTSVRGHLMAWENPEKLHKWELETIPEIFNTDLEFKVMDSCKDIEKNLKTLGQKCDYLILWTDYDREGESIAYEIINLIQKARKKEVKLLRAKFSSLTEKDILYSIDSLQKPNKNLADAVEFRQKIDLKIGASFTRFQTLCFRDLFYANPSFIMNNLMGVKKRVIRLSNKISI